MQVTIKDVLGDQLRLAYSDSVYADLDVGADGVLTITPTGEALELVATVGVGSLGVGGVVVVTTARVLQNVTANAAILTAGTLDDARVAESNVVQHQAALSIGWGQITGAPDYLDQAAADLLYSPLGHPHDAGDITTGTLAVARGGTGLTALGGALEILRVNAAGTALEFAAAATDAFASVGDAGGVEQFAAAGADMLRFAAGSDLAIAFDAATNKVTFSYVGGGTGGITAAYTTVAVGASSATATGADTATFAAAGNGLSAALDAGAKTVTYTLDETVLSIAATQLTGTLADALVAESNVTQHEGALSIGAAQLTGALADGLVVETNVTQHQGALSLTFTQLSDASSVLDAVQGLAALGTALHVLRVNAAGTALEFAEIDAGVDLAAAYDWTGPHTFADTIGLNITPSTWYPTLRAIEGTRGALVFQSDGAGYTYLTRNAYHDAVGWKHKAAAAASSLWLGGGIVRLNVAVSASAGTTASWVTRIEANNTGIGFFGATPVAKPTAVAVTAAGIHAALVSLGLISA